MRIILVLSAMCIVTMSTGNAATAKKQLLPTNTRMPACNDHRAAQATSGKAIGARRLGQEPDAQHIAAVVRKLDGCSRPIVLTDNVGFRGR